jgi:hypothetical protein
LHSSPKDRMSSICANSIGRAGKSSIFLTSVKALPRL